MRPPGSPRRGDLAGSNTSEPRGSAPRERDHRGGDHPVPSRTRQLSPPSPRVLQRKAAGGQGVALAEGAFLCLRASAREEMRGGAPHAPGEARRGMLPLRAFSRVGRHCPAGCRDRCRGPPTWPAFDASGACVPREWMDFFVSANGVAIAPVYPGLVLLLGLFGI